MRRRKLTAIRTETLEQWTVRRRADAVLPCDVCGPDSQLLSLSEAGAMSGLSHVQICLLVEAGNIHYSHTREGHLLICTLSLGAAILKGEQNNET